MSNIYDKWNEVKKTTDKEIKNIYVKPRDIFWMKIGQNVGHEQNGKGDKFQRPVLVLKKYTADMFLGIPLSTTIREGSFFYTFEFKNSLSTALLVQHKLFSTKRCMHKMGKVNEFDFLKIKDKLINLII